MKKALLVIVVIVIVAVTAIIVPRFIGPSGPKEKEPFTLNYKLNAENVKFFTKNDDMATLLACTPFYAGAQSLPTQKSQEFDEARVKKVDEIIAESDKLAVSALGLKSDVDDLRKALLDYLTICLKQDPRAKTFAGDASREVLRLYTQEALAEAEYKSIDTKSNDAFTRSFMQYMKTVKGVRLGALYLQDINNIAAFAAMGIEGLSGSKDAKITEANGKLDGAMAKFDGMKSQIEDVMSGMRKVDYGFKQLKTGDYYYACSAVNFMRTSIPELKKIAQNIKPGKYMDEQSIKFTRGYLGKFDNFSAGFEKYLASVPKSSLLSVASHTRAPDYAYAQDKPNDYGTAFLSIAQPVKDSGEAKEGWLASGWSGLKKVVHGTQSVIGVGLDVAGTSVKNLTQLGAGIYYGNSAKEIWTEMKKNSNQIITNWKENKSGADTMHTANQYINAIDDGAEYIAGKGVEKVIGDGWTSWGVGKVSKATVGILTGLGKGITLVGNRDAQASDYVIGTMEIASSAIGGSKLIIKGSQLPGFLTGLTKSAWISAKGSLNTVAKIAGNMEKAEMEGLMKTAIKGGMQTAGFEGRQAINQAMLEAIAQSNKALKAELATIIESGLKAGWANFNGTLRESLFDFTRKQFTGNLKSIASLFGSSGTDYVDNVMANWIEDAIKGMVDQAMAEAPIAKELKGFWTGSTVFTSIDAPPADTAKASKVGCDIGDIFRKLKGKSLPTSLRLDGAPSGSGSAVLQISLGGKASPASVRYNYSSGVLTIHQGIKGGTISIKGEASRMTQGYSISGPITITGGEKGIHITLSGSINITKLH